MLILTDRAKSAPAIHEYLARGRPCCIVDLRETPPPPSDQPIIICDAEIGDEAAAKRLGAALTLLRADAGVPVLFITRNKSKFAASAAVSLGATELISSQASPALIRAAADRLIDGRLSRSRAAPGPSGAAEKRAAEVKATLAGSFDAVRRGAPVPLAELDAGATVVLTAIREDKIRKWLDVVREYDDITYQHCLLVAGLVAALSLKLGVTANHQRLLSQAALIHDVGKARVPAGLLNKAGPLTPSETEIMRTHVTHGYDMLARQPGINPVILDVVRHHHEYCDGSGYPDRLRGPQISGYVRIVTICDIYAALIERRSYKAPMPSARAFAVLAELGVKLDAELLKTFQAVIADGG